MTKAPNEELFDQLMAMCQSVTPYLKGELGCSNDAMIRAEPADSAVVQQLLAALKAAHPEAGEAYWLTRTWDLLCWQPLYISMIGIYGLGCLPQFHGFAQQRVESYIMGFRFQQPVMHQGPSAELITLAGEYLTGLFGHYRRVVNELARCPKGFTQLLLADALMANLMLLQKLKPEFTGDRVAEQAKAWMQAFHLPEKHLSALQLQNNGNIKFVRRSCCLVYKTESGQLCSDCPRLHRNEKRASIN
ncbi:siderophore ferric iron reductase [Reinekea marinisedimentorum]|uniref:Siderophore ferric iron reductase n=1 Tax=Reinekea marinisedimentorum TaxID=230495 RepID=A0A4R3HZ12_9GAMM|nr:siderophore ferric iron reductase [Reinekea marinisedimentorum]TCS36739.1 siderophore ferric iron reductase [Reinekea marinisedimentorum]